MIVNASHRTVIYEEQICRKVRPRRMRRLLAIVLLSSGHVLAAGARIEFLAHDGWRQALRLSAEDRTLVVVPEIGGRIMAYTIGGKNVLWKNPAEAGKVVPMSSEPVNFGGHRTLPVPPEGNVPPDPVLDRGPATVLSLKTEAGEPFIRIVGAPQLDRGLVVVKDVRMLPDGSVLLTQRLRNLTTHSLRTGGSGLTQAAAPAFVVFPLNPDSRLPEGYRLGNGAGEAGMRRQVAVRGRLCIIDGSGPAGSLKVGADSPGPWIAWLQGDLAFVRHFNLPQAGRVYADEGCSVQVRIHAGKQPCIELELASSIEDLVPGGETVLEERWTLHRLLNPVKNTGDAAAAAAELQARGFVEHVP